jgi:hypothetical protein
MLNTGVTITYDPSDWQDQLRMVKKMVERKINETQALLD